MRSIKVLKRVSDGRIFTYAPELDVLVRRGIHRLIEQQIDDSGKVVDEIDLTRLDDDNSEVALREAIARKWPHLVDLIDRPEVARLASRQAKAEDNAEGVPFAESKILNMPGVDSVGAGIPDYTDEIPEEPEMPAAKPAPKAKAKPKAKAEPVVDAEPVPVDPAVSEMEAKVSAFADAMRKAPSREFKIAKAAEFGVVVEDGPAGTMVAEAVEKYSAMLAKGQAGA